MHAPHTAPTGEDLRAALAGLLDGLPPTQAAQAVDRLIANYRGRVPTHAPVLRDRSDVAAYAAYRMPATFEAVRSALAAFHQRLPEWVPATHVDLGGGTGAATWAVAATWPGGERHTTVLDWAQPALDLGAELARDCPALAGVDWRRQTIGGELPIPDGTDLVTVSYVLNELTEEARRTLTAQAARARAVLIVEPGTPDGYARVIQARDQLIAAGFRVVAPCPHSAACPIVPGADWCHFSARVSRSSLHRQVKGGSLAYEDEKFSYVAAVREESLPEAAPRIVRRPQIRKGQVLLDLCTPEDGLVRETVTKRHGERYRAARDADWGDAWA
ncbi:small ribosomal subunit Rsm22 family protein [Streptomyces sp. NPDC052396]|uniref:small ribosomal subunit Rsm22 family protein n=1 Tax=Streptomyces sp. NPDC052396 TaxID=3365689 RepID=UPI0037CFFE4F